MRAFRARLIETVDGWCDCIHRSRSFGWSIGILLMAASLFPKFFHSLGADSNVYVFLAGRMLDGERYCTDFFEYNTPFAMGIYTLPLAVGRLLGLSDIVAAKIFVLLAVVASITLVHHVLVRVREWSHTTRYNALIIALFFALNYRYDFYDNQLTTKSMMFLCCFLPYLFSVQARLEKTTLPAWLDYAIGALLGLSMLIKPHYVLFPLMLEVFLLWYTRSLAITLRRSNLCAAFVVIAGYGVILPVFFKGYIDCITYMSAFYAADTEGFVGWLDGILASLMMSAPWLLWFAVLRAPLQRLAHYGIFFASLLAAAAVLNIEMLFSTDQTALLVFFIALPLLYSMLLYLSAPREARGVNAPRKTAAILIALFSVTATFNLPNILRTFTPEPMADERMTDALVNYIRQYAPHEPIYAISSDTRHLVPPLLHVEARPYANYHSMNVLVKMWESKQRHPELASDPEWVAAHRYFYDRLLHFFKATPPRLVFVSRYSTFKETDYCLPLPLEMLQSESAEFAVLWQSHYRKIGTVTSVKDKEWLEERPVQKALLTFDGQEKPVHFPPPQPVKAWVDIYMRQE